MLADRRFIANGGRQLIFRESVGQLNPVGNYSLVISLLLLSAERARLVGDFGKLPE